MQTAVVNPALSGRSKVCAVACHLTNLMNLCQPGSRSVPPLFGRITNTVITGFAGDPDRFLMKYICESTA